MLDGDESHLPEAVTLHTVVYDITQTIEFIAKCQFFFSLLDGGGHTEAEPAPIIYFYLHTFVPLTPL